MQVRLTGSVNADALCRSNYSIYSIYVRHIYIYIENEPLHTSNESIKFIIREINSTFPFPFYTKNFIFSLSFHRINLSNLEILSSVFFFSLPLSFSVIETIRRNFDLIFFVNKRIFLFPSSFFSLLHVSSFTFNFVIFTSSKKSDGDNITFLR